jgi:NADH dehydrogenase (ubiquinone) 1 alpha subcomplex subunit 9
VNRFARAGCTVVVPFREEMAKRHLKVSGDLGRVVFLEADLRNTTSIEESVRHSDIVFNLIGRDYTTKNFDFEDVHVEGTRRIADAVAKYDVDRFIQVSSHSVSPTSPSAFYRTKYFGEQVAREIFPETTIVRPAPMFGFEDRLLHRLAAAKNILSTNNMQERFRPVHVVDVGAALEQIGYDDSTAGQTYELYGPKEYSMAELKEMVDREILKTRRHINVPKIVMAPLLETLNKVLWWPVGSRDEVEREYLDQVIDKTAKTFADLDMTPGDIANFTFKYLVSPCNDQPVLSRRGERMGWLMKRFTARIPQLGILRSSAHEREGEARRKEVSARPRRPIKYFIKGRRGEFLGQTRPLYIVEFYSRSITCTYFHACPFLQESDECTERRTHTRAQRQASESHDRWRMSCVDSENSAATSTANVMQRGAS